MHDYEMVLDNLTVENLLITICDWAHEGKITDEVSDFIKDLTGLDTSNNICEDLCPFMERYGCGYEESNGEYIEPNFEPECVTFIYNKLKGMTLQETQEELRKTKKDIVECLTKLIKK